MVPRPDLDAWRERQEVRTRERCALAAEAGCQELRRWTPWTHAIGCKACGERHASAAGLLVTLPGLWQASPRSRAVMRAGEGRWLGWEGARPLILKRRNQFLIREAIRIVGDDLQALRACEPASDRCDQVTLLADLLADAEHVIRGLELAERRVVDSLGALEALINGPRP